MREKSFIFHILNYLFNCDKLNFIPRPNAVISPILRPQALALSFSLSLLHSLSLSLYLFISSCLHYFAYESIQFMSRGHIQMVNRKLSQIHFWRIYEPNILAVPFPCHFSGFLQCGFIVALPIFLSIYFFLVRLFVLCVYLFRFCFSACSLLHYQWQFFRWFKWNFSF